METLCLFLSGYACVYLCVFVFCVAVCGAPVWVCVCVCVTLCRCGVHLCVGVCVCCRWMCVCMYACMYVCVLYMCVYVMWRSDMWEAASWNDKGTYRQLLLSSSCQRQQMIEINGCRSYCYKTCTCWWRQSHGQGGMSFNKPRRYKYTAYIHTSMLQVLTREHTHTHTHTHT